jgi:hypothetical protein
MANNLPLALAIADAACAGSGRASELRAKARDLIARHPESGASLTDISAAIVSLRSGPLPRMYGPWRDIWYVD